MKGTNLLPLPENRMSGEGSILFHQDLRMFKSSESNVLFHPDLKPKKEKKRKKDRKKQKKKEKRKKKKEKMEVGGGGEKIKQPKHPWHYCVDVSMVSCYQGNAA